MPTFAVETNTLFTMNENDGNGQGIQLDLPDDVAQGTYANLALITHSDSEFVLDFLRMMPGVPKPRVKSRIILTPEHAKRVLFALQDNVRKYEERHGEISVAKGNYVASFPGVSGKA